MNSNSSVRRRAVATKATTIADIRARLAKRQEPTLVECSACHWIHQMPRNLPTSSMANEIWLCVACGEQLFITITTDYNGPSQDDDIQTLLDLIIAP